MSGRRDRRARFRVEPGSLLPGRLRIGPEVSRHMQVMRLAAGDTVHLFDGEGVEVEATLRALSPEGAEVEVLGAVTADAEPALEVVLVQALPVKLPRMDTIVQQCTEVGVARILPVLSERGQVSRGGERSLAHKVDRWRRIADSAAQQCGRASVPRIASPVALAALSWEDLPSPRLLLDPGGRSLRQVAGASRGVEGVTLLVGPEGGWSEEEVDAAAEHGAERVRCGPRVLRADTAGAVAIALVQYEWGDLG